MPNGGTLHGAKLTHAIFIIVEEHSMEWLNHVCSTSSGWEMSIMDVDSLGESARV
jgi:hypothetical protein